MVVRATPVRFWNWRMSSMTISACSIRSELLQGGVHGGSLVIDLGGAAPDHGGACHAGALLELADVVHDHLGVLHPIGTPSGWRARRQPRDRPRWSRTRSWWCVPRRCASGTGGCRP